MQTFDRTLAHSTTFKLSHGVLEKESDTGPIELAGPLLAEGTIIEERYRIGKPLGEGGMGIVYRASHLSLGSEVALKTFRSSNFSPVSWERFQREARAIAMLESRYIVRVFDFGYDANDRPYYTMEIIDGESMGRRVRRKGALPIAEVLLIFKNVAQALVSAHSKGIVHRDLKPGNIHLVLNGEQVVAAKLVDFGIAKLAGLADTSEPEAQRLTRTGTIFGSPLYMSPEQSLGADIDARTDIYSLGCTMFEAITGRPPFIGSSFLATICSHQTDTPPRLEQFRSADDMPAWLQPLISKMLAKDPDKRVQSAQEMLEVMSFYKRQDKEKEIAKSSGNHAVGDSRAGSGSNAVNGRNAVGGSNTGNGRNAVGGSNAVSGRHAGSGRQADSCSQAGSGSQAGNQTHRRSGEVGEKDAKPALNISWRKLGIVFLVTCFGAMAIATTYFLKTSAARRAALLDGAPVTGSGELVPPAPEVTEGGERYLKGTKQTPDGKMKVFRFPRGYLGHFYPVDQRGWIKCVDEVEVPANARLIFYPSFLFTGKPYFFKPFASGDIDAINFDPHRLINCNWEDSHLHEAAQITGLDGLSLRDTEISGESIPDISKFKKLKVLDVSNSKITGHDLLKLTNLYGLEELVAIKTPGMADFLWRVDPAKLKVQRLNLKLDGLRDEDLAPIVKIPDLRKLNLQNCHITNKGLKLLTKMPHLEGLSLWGTDLGPEAIDTLAQIKTLKLVDLPDSLEGPEEKHKLQAALPNCKVLKWVSGDRF